MVGREAVQQAFRGWGAKFDTENIVMLRDHFGSSTSGDLFWQVARGKHDLEAIKDPPVKNGRLALAKKERPKDERPLEELIKEIRGAEGGALTIGDDLHKIEYKLCKDCRPIAGDEVFGFITAHDGIHIHRVSCDKAVQLMSNGAHRIVKARWKGKDSVEFLAGIRFRGIDAVGIVNKITSIISKEHNVNMRSISFDSNDGVFEGKVMVFVHDADHLRSLMEKLRRLPSVNMVERVDG